MNFKKFFYQLELDEKGRPQPRLKTTLKANIRVPSGYAVRTPKGYVSAGQSVNAGQPEINGKDVTSFDEFIQWTQSDSDAARNYEVTQVGDEESGKVSKVSPSSETEAQYRSAVDRFINQNNLFQNEKNLERDSRYILALRERLHAWAEHDGRRVDKKKDAVDKAIQNRLKNALEGKLAEMIHSGDYSESLSEEITGEKPDTPNKKPRKTTSREAPIPSGETAATWDPVKLEQVIEFLGVKDILTNGVVDYEKVKNDSKLKSLTMTHHIENLMNSINIADEKRGAILNDIYDRLLSIEKGQEKTPSFVPVMDEKGNRVGVEFNVNATSSLKISGKDISPVLRSAFGVVSPSIGLFEIFPVEEFSGAILNKPTDSQVAAMKNPRHALYNVFFSAVNDISVTMNGKRHSALDAISIDDENERRHVVQNLIEEAKRIDTGFSRKYAKFFDTYLKEGAKKYPPEDEFDDYIDVINKIETASANITILGDVPRSTDRSVASATAVSILLSGEENLPDNALYLSFSLGTAFGLSPTNHKIDPEIAKEFGVDVAEIEGYEEATTDLQRSLKILQHASDNGFGGRFEKLAILRESSVLGSNIRDISEAVEEETSVEQGLSSVGDMTSQAINYGESQKELYNEHKELQKQNRKRAVSHKEKEKARQELDQKFEQARYQLIENTLSEILGVSSETLPDELVDYVFEGKAGGGGNVGAYTEELVNAVVLYRVAERRGDKEMTFSNTRSAAYGGVTDLSAKFSDGMSYGILASNETSGAADAVLYQQDAEGNINAHIIEQKVSVSGVVETGHLGSTHAFGFLTNYLHDKLDKKDKKIKYGTTYNIRSVQDRGKNISTHVGSIDVHYDPFSSNQRWYGAKLTGRIGKDVSGGNKL